jgi:undecaprenyl-diphosphatase
MMELIRAVLLGAIQGLTEFFPISSSGHLVIFQRIFGLAEPEILFGICVHMGTLFAVVVYFRDDIRRMITAIWRETISIATRRRNDKAVDRDPDFKLAMMIIAGSVPTALIGLGFHHIAEALFSSLITVGIALLVTAGLLLGTRGKDAAIIAADSVGGLTWSRAVMIGVVQGMAIIPGISRSGATIAAALYLGVNRDLAGRFSFLLSIPAILGALLLSLTVDGVGTLTLGVIAAGTITAAGVGYLALRVLMPMVRRGRIYYFAPYCAIVGVIIILWGIIG